MPWSDGVITALISPDAWAGVNVLDRNCAHAEYVNLRKYPEGACAVEYVWSDGKARTLWYATKEEATERLARMGFILSCPYVSAA